MWHCGHILVSCLFTVTLFSCSVTGFQAPLEKSEKNLDPVPLKGSGSMVCSDEEKSSSTQKDKLLLLDQLMHIENNAIETKRKRSFPGENMPLDRLSVSTMDTKSKQKYHAGERGNGKSVDIPKRRVSVPIDRIGIGRVPSKRG